MTKQPTLSIQRTSLLNSINRTGKILKAVGLDPFKMDAKSIIKKARKKAGYYEELPGQVKSGLSILVDSINQESKPNPFGALAVKSLLIRILYGRFRMEQVLKSKPEIEHTAIKEPVFIIGMPRTGTTILHAMMHEDPAHRSPLAWECLLPYPAPTPETFLDNDQVRTVEKEFEQLFKLVPDFQKKHHMSFDSPQECLGINAFDFNSFQVSAQLYVPSYMNWFFYQADRLETMRFHKRYLQFLQSGGVQSERWLLKSPVHLMRLPEIFEVYPDAKIVMTHREPSRIVASTASLISSVRTLYSDHEDIVRTGHEQLDIWSKYFKRFLSDRKKLNREDQIIDLGFEDFAKDQIGTVNKIYDRFNWKLSDEAIKKFEYFLNENPRGKHGMHIYKLDQFGLSDKAVNKEFDEYIHFLSHNNIIQNNDLQKQKSA